MNMRHELLTSTRGADARGTGRVRSRFLRLWSSWSRRRRCRGRPCPRCGGRSRERLTDARERERERERLRLWRSLSAAAGVADVEPSPAAEATALAEAAEAEPAAFACGLAWSPDQDGTLDPFGPFLVFLPASQASRAASSRATRSFLSPPAGRPRFLSASRSSETFIFDDIAGKESSKSPCFLFPFAFLGRSVERSGQKLFFARGRGSR